MADGAVNDFHPFDKNLRGGAAAYIKEAGAWTPWDGATKNKVWDTVTLAWVSMQPGGGSGGGSIPDFDYIALGYTGADLTTIAYKRGGSGGTTVATRTLVYSSGILQSVAIT